MSAASPPGFDESVTGEREQHQRERHEVMQHQDSEKDLNQ